MGVADEAEQYLRSKDLAHAAAEHIAALIAVMEEAGSMAFVLVGYSGDEPPHAAAEVLCEVGERAVTACLVSDAADGYRSGLVALRA